MNSIFALIRYIVENYTHSKFYWKYSVVEIAILIVLLLAFRNIYLQLRGSPDAVVDINEMIKHALTFLLYLFS